MYPRNAKLIISKLRRAREELDQVRCRYSEQYYALTFLYDQLLLVEAQVDLLIGDNRQ